MAEIINLNDLTKPLLPKEEAPVAIAPVQRRCLCPCDCSSAESFISPSQPVVQPIIMPYQAPIVPVSRTEIESPFKITPEEQVRLEESVKKLKTTGAKGYQEARKFLEDVWASHEKRVKERQERAKYEEEYEALQKKEEKPLEYHYEPKIESVQAMQMEKGQKALSEYA
jgi:hypothetical protein